MTTKQITLTKDLLALCKAYTKENKNNDIARQIFCDFERGKSTITDAYKLLNIPNDNYLIQQNKDTFEIVPSHIINHAIFNKYKKLLIGYNDETKEYEASFNNDFTDLACSYGIETSYPNVTHLDTRFNYSIEFNVAIRNTGEHNAEQCYIKKELKRIKDYIAEQKLRKNPISWELKDVYIELLPNGKEIIGKTACRKECDCPELFGKEVIIGYIGDCPNFDKKGYPLTQLLDSLEALSKLTNGTQATVHLDPSSNKTPIKITTIEGSEALIMPIRLA